MLSLFDIKKSYKTGDDEVEALRGVTLHFRKSEFASILGPSGCGKTTMLNIIGGLDIYNSGDLIISGRSTKNFKDSDWDNYRNKKIGFIFQSYNLIPHLDILKNVELALTISGISSKERKKRATEALEKVGLSDKLKKKPNQLSGGQMQRVSIARALINNPEIILADEPTGALDSTTSLQIMELLKEIAKEKLVIMVTHNSEIADKYSTRIVKLFDGEVMEDSDPYIPDEEPITTTVKSKEKSTMSFLTALSLSFKNLLTKKVRTTITAIAGSIGIIGVGLVLALSNGFNDYLKTMESGSFGTFPIVVSEVSYSIDLMQLLNMGMAGGKNPNLEAFPSSPIVLPKKTNMGEDFKEQIMEMIKFNNLNDEFFEHLEKMDSSWASVQYTYAININLISKNNEGDIYYPNSSDLTFQQLLGNKDFLKTQYEFLEGDYPKNVGEVLIIVDKYNRVDVKILEALGLNSKEPLEFKDLMGGNLKLVYNDGYYEYNSDKDTFSVSSSESKLNALYDDTENTLPLSVSGVIRIKDNIDFEMMFPGIGYTSELVDNIYEKEASSLIVERQLAEKNKTRNVLTGSTFKVNFDLSQIMSMDMNEYLKMAAVFFKTDDKAYMLNAQLKELGGLKIPSSIYLYPKSYTEKVLIKEYIDVYNGQQSLLKNVINYMDMTEMATSMLGSIIDVISIVLLCFAAISLVVSSLMIAIVTYVSVVERIKEIGILRSIGARKIDILNVFNAETTMIGFTSGAMGVFITYILSIPANIILRHFLEMDITLAALRPQNGLPLVAVSIVLSFVAGLIPAILAAKKDPVEALRTD